MDCTRAKLTALESISLDDEGNLADAHTHQTPSPAQRAEIVERLPQIFTRAARIRQHDSDQEALYEYHQLVGQIGYSSSSKSFLCYSSSQALEILANYLRLLGVGSVAMCEPAFDNLADTLKRHGLELHPAPETAIELTDFLSGCSIPVGALVATFPNNPTGTYATADELALLANRCAQTNVLLIIDACFRAFEPNSCFDFYPILSESGCRFAVIEDTGKIWPALDVKVSFLNTSRSISGKIQDIHEDMLLNVSPFANLLVAEFSRLSRRDNLTSVRHLIKRNREALRGRVCGMQLAEPVNLDSSVSVDFLRLRPGLSAHGVTATLRQSARVQVLPGHPFFWSKDLATVDSYLRVALSRDTGEFIASIERMASILKTLY